MKVVVYSLGCKVNQYESGAIEKALIDKGHTVTDKLEFADCYIINTCAVTSAGERKSRTTIAKCNKLNKNAKIYVIGCAVQDNIKQFEDKQNVVYLNGNSEKIKVVEFLERKQLTPLPTQYEECTTSNTLRTRGFIKVQDGCNNFCSYCIVPYLRGRSRSREIPLVINEIRSLKDVNEIVLCGINLSDYKGGLISLAKEVDKCGIRFRFGSLEVNVITDEFLNELKQLKNFCPQFHLSLQSGSNSVLLRMNRHYTREKYIDCCKKIKDTLPIANITTDIIVGFPEESEKEFLDTVDLAKKVCFGDIHIFPYSERKGTVSSKMTDLPKSVKLERVKVLQSIKEDLKKGYINSFIGKSLTVLTEEDEGDFTVGYTENYIKIYLPKGTEKNKLIKVAPYELYKEGAKGNII